MDIKERIETLLERNDISDFRISVSIKNNGPRNSFVVGTGEIGLQINVLPETVSCFPIEKGTYTELVKNYSNTVESEQDAIEWILKQWLFQNNKFKL